MNIQTYIESGIIECYVLGAVSEAEKAEVEQLAEQYPEIKQEIKANQQALAEYVLQFQQTPPSHLREQLFAQVLDLPDSSSSNEKAISNKTFKINPKPTFYAYWAVAASILLVISVGFSIWSYNQWQSAEQRLSSLVADNQMLTARVQKTQANYQSLNEEIKVLSNPSNKTIQLKGLGEFPEALVNLYWNTQSKEVHLKVYNLPVPPSGKQYQLWSIIDGKPQDAGMLVFENNEWKLTKMKTINQAQIFAITLEKTGGVTSPEGKMYVKGDV